MGKALVKGVANFINGFFVKRGSQIRLISSMDSLLREGPKFVNGYIVEGKIVKAIIQQ